MTKLTTNNNLNHTLKYDQKLTGIASWLIRKGLSKTILYLIIPIFVLFVTDSIYLIIETLMMSQYVPESTYVKGVIFAYFQIFLAISILYVVGTSIYFGYCLGKQKTQEELVKIISNGALFTLLISIILFGILDATITPYLFGVQDISNNPNITTELIYDSRNYIILYSAGAMFLAIRNVYIRILRIEGFINQTFLINFSFYGFAIFFDWLFMGYLDLGMIGAGIAYLVSALISIVWGLVFVIFKIINRETIIRFNLKYFALKKKYFVPILVFGAPAATFTLCSNFNNISQTFIFANISNITNNYNYQLFFTQYQVFSQLMLSVTSSFTTIMQMLLSFMIGHKMFENSKKLIKITATSLICANLSSSIILVSLFPQISIALGIEYSSEIFSMWVIAIFSWGGFACLTYMNAFLTSQKYGKAVTKNIILQFIGISIPLQIIFYYSFFIGYGNVIGYMMYMPLWVILSSIYIRIKYVNVKQIIFSEQKLAKY